MAFRIGFRATGSHDERLIVAQHRRQNRCCPGVRAKDVFQHHRQGAFGPDDDRRHRVTRFRRRLGHFDIGAKQRVEVARVPLGLLPDIGLNNAHGQSGRFDDRGRQADFAKRETAEPKPKTQQRRPPALYAVAQPNNRRAGKNDHRHKAKTINTDISRDLRHGLAGQPRRSGRVPRKAGQDASARDFKNGKQSSEEKKSMRIR